MNRLIAVAANLLLVVCATLSAPAHAEEWRWCAAGDVNDTGPANGPFLVSRPFRVDGAPDFEASYETHARSIMGTVVGEFMLTCSQPSPSQGDSVEVRNIWLESIAGLPIDTMDIDWSPGAGAGRSGVADERDAYDSTGASGQKAFCMLQDSIDGQPRAMFSQVFSPPDLESDYDAGMARSFIHYAEELHGAAPDATATCHRHDSEASAHDMRNHEAEMRRIKDWTVVMTLWSH